jgi:hypothetical protein
LDLALSFVLNDEGGFRIGSNEPGGACNKGVSFLVFSSWRQFNGKPVPTINDLKKLTSGEAIAIYTSEFAKPIGFDELATGLDYAMLNTAVMQGVTGSIRILQTVLGINDPHGHYDIVPYQSTHNIGGAVMGAASVLAGIRAHLDRLASPLPGPKGSEPIGSRRHHALQFCLRPAPLDGLSAQFLGNPFLITMKFRDAVGGHLAGPKWIMGDGHVAFQTCGRCTPMAERACTVFLQIPCMAIRPRRRKIIAAEARAARPPPPLPG